MSRIRWYGPTIVLLLTVLLVMVLGPGIARQIAYTHTHARVQFVRESLADSEFLAELSRSFRNVSKVVEPSVVAIRVLARVSDDPHDAIRRLRPDLDLDEFFRQFDQEDEEQAEPTQPDRYAPYTPPVPVGSGSGWVYRHAGGDEEGYYIITNNHVVRGADQVKVRFHDGAEYEAKIVGTDARTDIAVLTVNAEQLIPAAIAGEQVEQGDIVFAFGSPLSFDFSMSQGIISATGRELGIIRVRGGGYENFIQTDAMINPGNSGGPLTNIYGEVVGMNTAIAAGSGPRTPGNGTFVGLGFAIPVEMVVKIADRLIEEGVVRRGFLGISLPAQDLDARMARTFGFDGEGVLVNDVNPGSPAERAGIRRGDIITKVDGEPTPTIAMLRSLIADYRPGTKVEVELFRDGETKVVEVELGEFPDMTSASVTGPSRKESEVDAEAMTTLRKLGITGVQDFNETAAEELGVEPFPAVMVTSVRRHSIAAAEGLQRGMLITHVMNDPVTNVEELVEAFGRYDVTEGVRISVKAWDPTTETMIPMFMLLQLPAE
ncbi:MAG: Do family serine endopeptidase [Phycisphaeraceae bacterium]